MQAGFKGNGMFPLNRENVLKDLPSHKTLDQMKEDNAIIDNAFEIFLRNLYMTQTQHGKIRNGDFK